MSASSPKEESITPPTRISYCPRAPRTSPPALPAALETTPLGFSHSRLRRTDCFLGPFLHHVSQDSQGQAAETQSNPVWPGGGEGVGVSASSQLHLPGKRNKPFPAHAPLSHGRFSMLPPERVLVLHTLLSPTGLSPGPVGCSHLRPSDPEIRRPKPVPYDQGWPLSRLTIHSGITVVP